MLKIRLSMGGVRKRPVYKIVVADSRFPRDGRFVEKLGLATSWIKTLVVPLCLVKYFRALKVDCCLLFPPGINFTFLSLSNLTSFKSFLL